MTLTADQSEKSARAVELGLWAGVALGLAVMCNEFTSSPSAGESLQVASVPELVNFQHSVTSPRIAGGIPIPTSLEQYWHFRDSSGRSLMLSAKQVADLRPGDTLQVIKMDGSNPREIAEARKL